MSVRQWMNNPHFQPSMSVMLTFQNEPLRSRPPANAESYPSALIVFGKIEAGCVIETRTELGFWDNNSSRFDSDFKSTSEYQNDGWRMLAAALIPTAEIEHWVINGDTNS